MSRVEAELPQQGAAASTSPAGSVTVRVRYAETDAMQVAHHASYLIWFEQGRTELLRQAGLPYRELEAQGYLLPVAEMQVRFIAPARYDDILTVQTALAELRSRRLALDYKVANEHGQLLATGSTAHIVIAADSRRPARLPQAMLERLRR